MRVCAGLALMKKNNHPSDDDPSAHAALPTAILFSFFLEWFWLWLAYCTLGVFFTVTYHAMAVGYIRVTGSVGVVLVLLPPSYTKRKKARSSSVVLYTLQMPVNELLTSMRGQ